MIGGELAAEAAPNSRRVPGEPEPYALGWVADWLYGDAALPPMPLPPRDPIPAHPRPAPVHAEPPVHAQVSDARPTPARRRARKGRRSRQLALL